MGWWIFSRVVLDTECENMKQNFRWVLKMSYLFLLLHYTVIGDSMIQKQMHYYVKLVGYSTQITHNQFKPQHLT